MSARRSPAESKCPNCRINKKLCFCESIKVINNNIFVTIIMHHREKHLTTNTATLTTKILSNSKIVLRGLPGKIFNFEDLNIENDETPYYLFPHEDAIIIDEKFVKDNKDKKIHLIVPDGTWSQAKKVYRREESLHHIKCVKLPDGIKSEYKLRKSPREDGVCTFEAISHSLKILESVDNHNQMMTMFNKMVQQFIKARYTFHND
jgi:DTW domain-containing protein YfiP